MQGKNDFIRIAEDNNFVIDINIIQMFAKIQRIHSFREEWGGIIIGYYDCLCKGLRISDITYPQKNDVCGSYSFKRKSCGHQEIMDELWEKSNHKKSYLGEWHTHNQYKPIPSWVDIRNWKKISKRGHNFDELLFAIVGKEYIGFWSVNLNSINEIGFINREVIK